MIIWIKTDMLKEKTNSRNYANEEDEEYEAKEKEVLEAVNGFFTIGH